MMEMRVLYPAALAIACSARPWLCKGVLRRQYACTRAESPRGSAFRRDAAAPQLVPNSEPYPLPFLHAVIGYVQDLDFVALGEFGAAACVRDCAAHFAGIEPAQLVQN